MADPGDKILLMQLGAELYGLEVGHIQEILESPRIHHIPCAPPHYLGAVNFHGTILPVIDLAAHLDLGEHAIDQRLVVIDPHLCGLALAVHGIRGIVPLDLQGLIAHSPGNEQGRDCIRSILQNGPDLINLLDMDRFLNSLILEKSNIGGTPHGT